MLDFEARFREAVIEDFAATYAAGRTPIPCVRCNQRIKFADLLGWRAISVRMRWRPDITCAGSRMAGASSCTAPPTQRDQSYFLFATTPEQLAFLRFPLGDLPKAETRGLAARFALPVADKPDSQDICFVPNGSYARVVEKLRPGAAEPGEIVHVDGRVLGRHDGLIHFTVGQRRGLAVATGERLYVVRLEPERARVIVGPKGALDVPYRRAVRGQLAGRRSRGERRGARGEASRAGAGSTGATGNRLGWRGAGHVR